MASARPVSRSSVPAPGSQSGWLSVYDNYIEKNASHVSQIESALRSLTYVIPGRFRDAEIASESLHSGVQLISMYHDSLLSRAIAHLPGRRGVPSLHSRYTRHWTKRSGFYRRIATVLQMATYVQLLLEMAAKRRGGNSLRWKLVVVVEAVKSFCRLLLLYITRSRSLVTPVLPERPPIPSNPNGEDDGAALRELMGEETLEDLMGKSKVIRSSSETEWEMPRTGMVMPPLPKPGDISGYLVDRVLSADDIKPATSLLTQLRGTGHAAEVMHILAPLVYASVTAYVYQKKPKSKLAQWSPWVAGVVLEYGARQLRNRSLGTPQLEKDEWTKRGWAMCWWAMRGAFYDNVTKGLMGGVKKRVPLLVSGIVADYEYLWENYYFSTTTS